MPLWGKNQAKLDADMLKLVGQHKFAKATKLLAAGANPLAVDAQGNGILHCLTAATGYVQEFEVDEFLCRALQLGVDINARNNAGQTCVHLVGMANHSQSTYYKGWGDEWGHTRCSATKMLAMLVNRGAALNAQDNKGDTVAHIAAGAGLEGPIQYCFETDRAMAGIKNKAGFYPYECAMNGVIKNHDLALRMKINYGTGEPVEENREAAAAVAPAAEEAAPVNPNNNWLLLDPAQVAHVSVQAAIGYKLTDLFNFAHRTYTRITHNLETHADTSETRSFDDFSDKSLFAAAREELLRLGGKAEECAVTGVKPLDKPKL